MAKKHQPATTGQATTLARIELEVEIDAPPATVWRALVAETTMWWPRDFYTGPAKGFHLEPRLGGRLYEDWGDGHGAIWYQVFAINPEVSLDLQGCIAVPHGPALTLLHLELASSGPRTVLRVSDSTIGVAGHEGEQAKSAGWQQIFALGLKGYVESRSS